MLVIGGAPPPPQGEPAEAVDAVRRLVDAGAKPRARPLSWPGLAGARANELYRALTED